MKARGVSSRNLRIDYNSNENIFKQDDYKMKLGLSFPDSDELNCKKSLFMRHITILQCMLAVSGFHHLYLMTYWWSYYGTLLSLCNILMIITLIFEGLMLINVDRFIFFLPFIRMSIEFDNISNIYYSCYNAPDNVVFAFYFLFLQFFSGMLYNLSFAFTINESLPYYGCEILFVLSFAGHHDTYFIIRLLRNLFSLRFLGIISLMSFILLFQYGYSKKLRQFWALYDSFKKSYFTMKCIYDDFPNPVFILQKKDLQICYKNRAGERLYSEFGRQNTSDKKIKTKSESEFQMKDIVNIKLFENEINKCLKKNNSFFDFPLISLNKEFFVTKEHEKFPTLYEGNLGTADWVKVYVFPCEWKQVESVMVQMIESSYLHKNNLYEFEVLEKVNHRLDLINTNFTFLSYQAPTPNTETVKANKSPITMKFGNTSKSPFIHGSKLDHSTSNIFNNLKGTTNQNHLNYFNKIAGKGKADLQASKMKLVASSPRTKRPSPNTSNSFASPYLLPSNSLINTISEVSVVTSFDYTLLYMGNIHMNFVYDMFLSLQIFNSLKNGKYINKVERVKIDAFINYFINYLFPFAYSKGYKIELLQNDLNEEDAEINYIYFRVLLFNILMFIMTNTGNSDENKKLEIKIVHSIFGQTMIYYKMILIFNESESKVDYEQISRLFESLKKYNIKDLDLNKFKSLNLGLIIAYYICNSIFSEPNSKNNLVIKQTNKTKQITTTFFVPSKGEKDIKEKDFKNFDCNYFKKAYDRIIEKVYMKGVVRKERKKLIGDYDYGEDDTFNPTEENKISLINDTTNAHEIGLLMKKSKNLIKSLSMTAHFDKIKNAKLTFVKNETQKKTETQLYKCENKITVIKYCPIPRFLIVEDNAIGRLGIVDELKKMSFKYSIDVACDGGEAVDKFKILLNRGCIFDFIFMDITLVDMDGIEATRIIRDFERDYHVHTNIVSVSVENKGTFEEGLFDENFEKPIKDCSPLKICILQHLRNFRPDLKKI